MVVVERWRLANVPGHPKGRSHLAIHVAWQAWQDTVRKAMTMIV